MQVVNTLGSTKIRDERGRADFRTTRNCSHARKCVALESLRPHTSAAYLGMQKTSGAQSPVEI